MKQTKLFALPILIAFLAGCAAIQPGSDATVVNAERTTQVAYNAFDSFFHLERVNEAYIKANAPEVHRFANSLRQNAPNWLSTARILTKTYKQNRTPENKANLETAIHVLEAAIAQVQVYSVQAAAKTNP